MSSSGADGKQRHLLILTQVYRPEPNFITADVADRLAADMRVTVITGHPNYPYGSFYPGTRWWRITRSVEGKVTVWRLPFYPNYSLSLIRRAASYLSFALAAAVTAPFVARRPDVVWVYHGPFTTGLAALWYRFVVRARVVFTCADLWPESFVAAGVAREGRLIRLLFAYSRAMNRIADLLVGCTRGTLARSRRDGIPGERLAYVPVWVDGIDTEPLADGSAPHGRNIVYAGNLGPSQKLDILIRAAALFDRERLNVTVDIYGSGASEAEYRRLAASLGTANVVFHGRVSPERAFEASATAFAQFIALEASPLFAMTVPSKLYAAFAAGTPILCGLTGEACEVALESGGAWQFEVDDPASLVAAVKRLLALSIEERNRVRQRLRDHYQARFARQVLLEQYSQLLRPGRHSASPRRVNEDSALPMLQQADRA